jgi:hypothetical protein
MSRPFFMHIHIHSQTQRCTIRSGVLVVHSLIVLLLALVAGKRQPRGENEWLRNRQVPSGLMELLLGLS